MTFLASAFDSLGSPHSQPWHLVLATSPGLLSLGGKAWQRHPTWEESDKREAERKRQKVRESGPFLELVECPQTGLHTHLFLGLRLFFMFLFSMSL